MRVDEIEFRESMDAGNVSGLTIDSLMSTTTLLSPLRFVGDRKDQKILMFSSAWTRVDPSNNDAMSKLLFSSRMSSSEELMIIRAAHNSTSIDGHRSIIDPNEIDHIDDDCMMISTFDGSEPDWAKRIIGKRSTRHHLTPSSLIIMRLDEWSIEREILIVSGGGETVICGSSWVAPVGPDSRIIVVREEP